MPTAPIIIPIIVAGLMVGSLLASQTRKLSKKKLIGVSAVTGLLNMAEAYLVYTLFPPTVTRFGGAGAAGGTSSGLQLRAAGAAGATSEISFLILSFITGLLIVLAVVGIALAYARHKSGQPQEETETETEESKLEET